MLCKNPYMVGVMPCGCGQCLPCRLRRKKIWTHRIMLETMKHEGSCFITLTYDDKHLPDDGSLVPREVQLWLKRFRRRIAPKEIRYFLVGEYGGQNQRPHYHVAVFGYEGCYRGRTEHRVKKCCPGCDLVQTSWSDKQGEYIGGIDVGQLNFQSASYISSYVQKGLTTKDDSRNSEFRKGSGLLLGSRHPEFCRMSLKPGIGADAMDEAAYSIENCGVSDYVDGVVDVPASFRHGPKYFPLGRYLRRKLREKIGCGPDTPEYALKIYGAQMRELFEKTIAVQGWKNRSKSEIYKDIKAQEILNLEGKVKLYEAK